MRNCFLIFVFMLVATGIASAQYVTNQPVLSVGKPVTIQLPAADTLQITYRPGSNIAVTQKIFVDGTSYKWTPNSAGIVALSVPGKAVQTVSVQFERFPWAGFLVLIIAGGILFGGAIYASVNLFGKTPAENITNRPDT